jgi:hypothetical protein
LLLHLDNQDGIYELPQGTFSEKIVLIIPQTIPLCDYNSETTPANNLVCRAEEKQDVSEHEW